MGHISKWQNSNQFVLINANFPAGDPDEWTKGPGLTFPRKTNPHPRKPPTRTIKSNKKLCDLSDCFELEIDETTRIQSLRLYSANVINDCFAFYSNPSSCSSLAPKNKSAHCSR
jgi:hypothetical protein